MNKHELKSLLENIYTALTEDDPMHDTDVPFLQQVLRGARPLYGPGDMSPTGTVLWPWELPPPKPAPPVVLPPNFFRGLPGILPGSPIPPGQYGNPYVPFRVT